MGKIDRKLLIALAWRQLFFLALVAAFASLHFANGGEWMGWPAIVACAVLLNVIWSFVA